MTLNDLVEGLRRKTLVREALGQRPVELLVQCRLSEGALDLHRYIAGGRKQHEELSAERFRLLQRR